MGLQSIRDDCLSLAVPLQRLLQEHQGRSFVPFLRDVALQNLTLVINSTPQVMALLVDFHEHLIKVPAPLAKALHPADPLTTYVRSKQRAKPVPPKPHGFMADVNPALCEQVLDFSQAKRKTDIHHHNQADDLGR